MTVVEFVSNKLVLMLLVLSSLSSSLQVWFESDGATTVKQYGLDTLYLSAITPSMNIIPNPVRPTNGTAAPSAAAAATAPATAHAGSGSSSAADNSNFSRSSSGGGESSSGSGGGRRVLILAAAVVLVWWKRMATVV